MFSISRNGIITIDAGDSAIFTLNIDAGCVLNPLLYELEQADRICFSVMQPNQGFQQGVLRKIFTTADLDTNHNLLIKFDCSDTEHLLPGRYTYQIKLVQLRNNQEYVYTIIPPRKFIIC